MKYSHLLILFTICYVLATKTPVERVKASKRMIQQLTQHEKCNLKVTEDLGEYCYNNTDYARHSLALGLSNCLFVSIGKEPIICSDNNATKCASKLTGDNWQTFSKQLNNIQVICYFNRLMKMSARVHSKVDEIIETSTATFEKEEGRVALEEEFVKISKELKEILQEGSNEKAEVLNAIQSSTVQIVSTMQATDQSAEDLRRLLGTSTTLWHSFDISSLLFYLILTVVTTICLLAFKTYKVRFIIFVPIFSFFFERSLLSLSTPYFSLSALDLICNIIRQIVLLVMIIVLLTAFLSRKWSPEKMSERQRLEDLLLKQNEQMDGRIKRACNSVIKRILPNRMFVEPIAEYRSGDHGCYNYYEAKRIKHQ